MAAVVIRKKDVDRIGKELLKEMFEFLHDEYILTEFKEMKEVQKEFLKNLALNHINTLSRQYKITKERREVLIKPFIDDLLKIDENSLDTEKKIKFEYDSKLVKSAMEDEGIDTEGIYQTLNKLKLDMEIDEDLYYKTKSFLDIFRVFEIGYIYLED